jgi:hypothetical protein
VTPDNHPPLDEVFLEGDQEYILAAAPKALPLFIVRGGLWASSLLSVVVIFLVQVFGYLLGRRIRPNYRVTLSRRDVSRRPYLWRLLRSEEYSTLEEAESRQQEIAAEWDAAKFANAEPIKNRRRN